MSTAATEATVKRRRFQWLRPPEGGPGGTMSLYDHLRELRYRVTIAALGIVAGGAFAAFFYDVRGGRHVVEFFSGGRCIVCDHLSDFGGCGRGGFFFKCQRAALELGQRGLAQEVLIRRLDFLNFAVGCVVVAFAHFSLEG